MRSASRTLLFSAGAVFAPVALAHAQQAVPTRALTKPDIEYSEPFSQINGVRELRDGRLIVSDLRDRTLQAIDLVAGRATPIGRPGAGPGEWTLPLRLFGLPGDSTVLFDAGNTRYLVIGPDAKPVRTFSTISDAPPPTGGAVIRGDAAGRGDAGRGDAGRGDAGRGDGGRGGGRGDAVGRGEGGRAALRFGGGGISLMIPAAADARGRLYSMGIAVQIDERTGDVTSADSAPILRYDIATKKTDTVAYINLPSSSASGNVSGGGGGRGEVRMVMGQAGPYAPADGWTVLPDGRIAIARAANYRMEIVQPGGRRTVGAPVAYTPVRVGDAEKQEWRESQRNASRVMISVDDRGGGANRSVSTPSNVDVPEPAAWPATKPPFPVSGVLAAPNGETWVLRSRAARDNIPTYDVFDGQARLVGRVTLAARTRVVGFGPKGVYIVRLDEDDLQYLQRHALSWTGCPPELRENCR